MEPIMIFRHSSPNKLDTMSFGTVCKVNPKEYYIQLSTDQENPNWEKMDSVTDEIDAMHRRDVFLNVYNT